MLDDTLDNQKLGQKLRKKYAKAKRNFELGIWGSDIDCIKCITLTTRLGSMTRMYKRQMRDRNNWEVLLNDNRHLRQDLRKEGILAEDCFCVEVSPINHLLHMHGFYRLKAAYYSKDLHKIVSEAWLKNHDAEVVWVKDMWNANGAIKYDVKHAVKNYLDGGYNSMRLIKSKGWLPLGWKQTEKAIVRWALGKRDVYLEENDPYYEPDWNEDYLYNKWGVVNDLIKRWCYGEQVLLEARTYYELIVGNKIIITEKENEI